MTSPAILEAHGYFFDLAFVRKSNSSLQNRSDADLVDILLDPQSSNPLAPNCLFDVQYYNTQRARVGLENSSNPIEHFLTRGLALDLPINPFFDNAFFRSQAGTVLNGSSCYVEYALANIGATLPAFHPFIDVGFITRQFTELSIKEVLTALFQGKLELTQPHPLFDLEFIRAGSTQPLMNLAEAFGHYWSCGQDLQTHPLFFPAYYKEHFSEDAGIQHSLYHYLTSNDPQSPQPLFDQEFYCDQALEIYGHRPKRALEHYMTIGQHAGLNPSPYFDAAFYAQQSGVTDHALAHYLQDGHRRFVPHPLIDPDENLHFERARGLRATSIAQEMAQDPGRIPLNLTPEFDPVYFAHFLDQTDASAEELRHHYFAKAFSKDIRPNGLMSLPYIKHQCNALGIDADNATQAYFTRGWQKRKRLLIALENTDDTGANRAWLKLIRSLARSTEIEVILVAGQVGRLSDAFFQCCHVWHFSQKPLRDLDDAHLAFAVKRLSYVLAKNPPQIILAEVNHGPKLLRTLNNFDAPKIGFADTGFHKLQREELEIIGKLTTLCASSSGQIQSNLEDLNIEGLENIALGFHVQVASPPNGQTRRARIRRCLGIADDQVVVAASGTPDITDGADLFGAVAANCLEAPDFPKNVIFIWQGRGHLFGTSPLFYANHYARTVGAVERFRIVDNIDHEALLEAADLYLDTRRSSAPLHNLIQAKASGLSVLLMSNSPEAFELADQTGAEKVDAFDIKGARNALENMIQDAPSGEPLPKVKRAKLDKQFGVEAFIDRINKLIAQAGSDFRLPRVNLSANRKLLLLVTNDGAREDIVSKIEAKPLGNAPDTFILNRLQDSLAKFPKALRKVLKASGCDEMVIGGDPKRLSLDELTGFDTAIWLANGDVGEVSEIYRLGLGFDQIIVNRPTAVDEMTKLNPKIAALMSVLEGGLA